MKIRTTVSPGAELQALRLSAGDVGTVAALPQNMEHRA